MALTPEEFLKDRPVDRERVEEHKARMVTAIEVERLKDGTADSIAVSYAENGHGYLIEKLPAGDYRFVFIQPGSEPIYGAPITNRSGAVYGAIRDWRERRPEGFESEWSTDLLADG